MGGEKHFGSVTSCIRTGDPHGKYFTVLWVSLDSEQVGHGDGWVLRLPAQGQPFRSRQPGKCGRKQDGYTSTGRGTMVVVGLVLAGHSFAFIMVSAGRCPLSSGLAPSSDKHRHLGHAWPAMSSKGSIGKTEIPFVGPMVSPKAPEAGTSNESGSGSLCHSFSPHLHWRGGCLSCTHPFSRLVFLMVEKSANIGPNHLPP